MAQDDVIQEKTGTSDESAVPTTDIVQTAVNKTAEGILDHLLFHKSLIDENDGGERINKYMQMVQDLENGQTRVVKDPFDKAMSLAFELIMQQHFDPWDIDLIKFSKMYLQRAKKEQVVDFVMAGKLIFMAWSILKMQSEKILNKATPPSQGENEDTWAPGDLNLYESPEDLDYTTMVMKGIDPPLQEMLRRQGTRPVTLMELVDAFDEAKKEAEIREKMMEFRKSRYKVDIDFDSKVHKEDLCEDIILTWKRIMQYNGNPIPLSNLCSGFYKGNEDMITVFVSVLFLAHMKIVKLTQRSIPSGEIFIQNISNGEEDISEMIEQAVSLDTENTTTPNLPPQEKLAAAS